MGGASLLGQVAGLRARSAKLVGDEVGFRCVKAVIAQAIRKEPQAPR
jgi:hypothetical protein